MTSANRSVWMTEDFWALNHTFYTRPARQQRFPLQHDHETSLEGDPES